MSKFSQISVSVVVTQSCQGSFRVLKLLVRVTVLSGRSRSLTRIGRGARVFSASLSHYLPVLTREGVFGFNPKFLENVFAYSFSPSVLVSSHWWGLV